MIAVVGSINWDIAVHVPHLPKVGETVLGSRVTSGLGGKGGNQAVAAARAGGRVRLIGCIGTDAFGQSALRLLAAEGVSLERVSDTNTNTGMALIGVDDHGQNSIMIASGANHDLEASAIDQLALEHVRVLLVQLEIPLSTARAALREARVAGARTVLNASPVPPESGLGLLDDVDVLLVNEVEAGQLLNRSRPDSPRQALGYAKALHMHGSTVVLTLGAQGVVWCDGSGDGHLPGHVVTVVDTTGAGDAFAGALSVALGEDQPLERAIAFANAAGALAATRVGAAASAPMRLEIEGFLKRVNGRPISHRASKPNRLEERFR